MAIKDPWEWLSLVDIDGPFLSKAALKSTFPTGLDRPFNAIDDVNSTFVYEHTIWAKAWTNLHGKTDASGDFAWRDRWVTAVLRELLQWDEYLVVNPDSTLVASSPDGDVTVRPWAALDIGNGLVALVVVVDPTEDLRRFGTDGWAADSIDRTAALLRETGVTVGLVTDGRWWGIVSSVSGVTTASGVFDALIWREERDSRDAFLALAGLVSLAGGAPEKRLPKLFEASVASAEAITEALGDQVRRAVELVLQAMSESHLRALANGEDSPLPADAKQVYEASVSVLMRVIFLLFAEERGLLPQHQMYRDSYAIAGVRTDLERQAQNDSEEALDHTWETWHRLLATSTAIFSGATFEDTRMPAYGGSMFDPTRFPWLRSTNAQGLLTVRVSDRVMLKVLQAVQIAHVGGEARQLSFRDLDVEQIGYVYEGLLGYSAEYATDVVVGLNGKSGYEPEMALTELTEVADGASSGADFAKKLIAYLDKAQPSAKPATARQIAKAFEVDDETAAADARIRLGYVLLGHTEIVDKLAPLYALIRNDLRDFPYVVPEGGLVMTESPQRANTGTHYTPRSLAEEVVLQTLEPLVYSPGPLNTENQNEWVLRSSTEILNLKVADIAAGSGAFLVAAARYLAGRLIEARSKEGLTAGENEDVKRWAIREVVGRCLYGADINGMAVEMCKLSLWLISMDPGKPFSFVDDRVFHGNSLLGVTSERQLRAQHIDPGRSHLRPSRLLQIDVDSDLEKAAKLRRELASGQVDDADRMRSTRAKRKLLAESRDVTAKLRDVADGIIAAGLLEGGKPGKALDARYDDLADALFAAYSPNGVDGDRNHLDAILVAGLTPTVVTGEALWKPLHWVIEAPDVMVSHGGFDAIIGNPPFVGSRFLSGLFGKNLREWLTNVVATRVQGLGDYFAYFVRRSSVLLNGTSGSLGLLCKDSIMAKENRKVALTPLLDSGMRVIATVGPREWPTFSAHLRYVIFWATWSAVTVRASWNGEKVEGIGANLTPVSDSAWSPMHERRALPENKGKAFVGTYPNGIGFRLNAAEADAMIRVAPANADVIRPYTAASDLYLARPPRAAEFIIKFGSRTLEEASGFREPFARVDALVKPDRMTKNQSRLRDFWWQFKANADQLYQAISGLNHCLAIPQDGKTLMPVRLSCAEDIVIDTKITAIALGSYAEFALLSSAPHRLWAATDSHGLIGSLKYLPRAFETFPAPTVLLDGLHPAGRALESAQTNAMNILGCDLRDAYTLLLGSERMPKHEVLRLLWEAHEDVDRLVLKSYGWDDISAEAQVVALSGVKQLLFSEDSNRLVLERLLKENSDRTAPNTVQVSATSQSVGVKDFEKLEGAMF
ncbi:Eco57I restriction-modification methylase domain-containing protein [Cryobacterium serini]|uniref:site-specific DNA-methyltransferase (adenine-specific) n=1 Tax=Cryobacterium serini TaxID=1259201 RepID=A0A4R9BVN9_9MICO|nr:SAM-dependent DNA methyltransferase [Cryobacterium serini]TFD91230.1 SAM-dependent DNA methyltransferase [Cryobacterium serini]